MLAAELRAGHVLVNAVCPGWVATDMGGPGGRPVEAGAASVVWAATLPDSGPTGGFFRDGRPLPWQAARQAWITPGSVPWTWPGTRSRARRLLTGLAAAHVPQPTSAPRSTAPSKPAR